MAKLLDNKAENQERSRDSANQGMRATRYGIFLNLLLSIIKGIAGVVGNSYALVADAIESLTDIATSSFVYYSLKVASRPPDDDHPYGHGKSEPFAALIVSLALFLAALGIAIQSLREIVTPHRAPAPFTLIVVIGVVALKEGLYQYQVRVAKKLGSTAIHTDAWHHRSDAITSIAVFFGIAIALIGGKGWESADDWAALFAACIITFNAWLLLLPAHRELMDAVPLESLKPDALTASVKVAGVVKIERCLVRKMGFDFYVDMHLTVNGSISVRDGHGIAHQVKHVIQDIDSRVADVLIHVEPED